MDFATSEDAPGADQRVWMTAGFAFAAVVAQAFTNHAWPADVRGSETDRLGGGLCHRPAAEPFAADPAWLAPGAGCRFVPIAQERALVEASLMPLSALPFGQEAVFARCAACRLPARYAGEPAANANARLSSQLNSMLCVSRFAHYIKLLGRDMVGLVPHRRRDRDASA